VTLQKIEKTIAGLARDSGFVGATVHVDTSKWSSRRRNIVIAALRDGVSTAGRDTSRLISHLTRAYDCVVVSATASIPLRAIRDDKKDALLAYTTAWVKIQRSQQNCNTLNSYAVHRFVRRMETGLGISSLPFPDIPLGERAAFIKEYLKDDEGSKRSQLADKIKARETLTIFIKADNAQLGSET
jgi:hypothetical protein